MIRRSTPDPRPTPRYPTNHRRDLTTLDGRPLVIRSIRPTDAPRLACFHAGLSEESVRKRYFHYVSLHARIAPARLEHICRADPTCEAVLVAITPAASGLGTISGGGGDGEARLVGVGRLEEVAGDRGEFAVLVSDAMQHQGVGRLLVEEILILARRRGLAALIAYIAPYNDAMQHLCQRLGFTLDYPSEGGPLRATLDLRGG